MKIEILGSGCPNCETLYAHTQSALAQKGLTAEVVKVNDMATILGYGVMKTPGLVIDGKVRISGRVPTVAEIAALL